MTAMATNQDMFEYTNIIPIPNYGLKWEMILTAKLQVINQEFLYRFHPMV